MVAYAADPIEGCAETADAARVELSKTISSAIFSRSESEKKKSRLSLIDFKMSSFELSETIETSIELTGVKVEKRGDEYCASILRDDLLNNAQTQYQQVKEIDLQRLPTEYKPRVTLLNEYQRQRDQVAGLMNYFPGEFTSKEMARVEQLKSEILKKMTMGYLRFNLRGANKDTAILIDNQKLVKEGESVELDSGTHTYKITSPNHCVLTGETSVAAMQLEEVQFNLKDHDLPRILISVNQANARIELDGKPVVSGESNIIDRCSGEVGYKVVFEEETKTDTIELVSGMDESINVSFMSNEQRQKLSQQALRLRSGERVYIGYQASVPDSSFNSDDTISSLRLMALWASNSWQWGGGILIGQGSAEPDISRFYEIYVHGRLQLTSVGSNNQPLNLLGLPIIPYIGLESGFANHRLGGLKGGGTTTQFPDPDSTSQDDGDWVRDHLIGRGIFGLQFPLGEDFTIDMAASKLFTMEESLEFLMGVSVKY